MIDSYKLFLSRRSLGNKHGGEEEGGPITAHEAMNIAHEVVQHDEDVTGIIIIDSMMCVTWEWTAVGGLLHPSIHDFVDGWKREEITKAWKARPERLRSGYREILLGLKEHLEENVKIGGRGIKVLSVEVEEEDE